VESQKGEQELTITLVVSALIAKKGRPYYLSCLFQYNNAQISNMGMFQKRSVVVFFMILVENLFWQSGHAFSFTNTLLAEKSPTQLKMAHQQPLTRRSLLQTLPAAALVLATSSSASSANAVMENGQEGFVVSKDITPERAKKRIKEGEESLQYLLDHFDEICAGGGDNVRRYLGIVGTSSGLYGIKKVMKSLQEETDDIVEYTETMDEIITAINGADGSAYMAIFVSSSSSSTPPEQYFREAKIEVKRALKSLKDLEGQLNITQ
jgi:hypothetical protein